MPLWLTLSREFLYFIIYSFLGWGMETCYCSIGQRRWVARGFLFGPICPIYGVGALLMIHISAVFSTNALVFVLVSIVTLSAWEYAVGWVLEKTTKIKYWDYSNHRFNLHGRITLTNSLAWGILAYLVADVIHPPIAGAIAALPTVAVLTAALLLLVITLVDAALTIRKLALMRKLMVRLEGIVQDIQLRAGELADELKEQLPELPDRKALLAQTSAALRESYLSTLDKLEEQSRRFRKRYHAVGENHFSVYWNELNRRSAELRERAEELKNKLSKKEL